MQPDDDCHAFRNCIAPYITLNISCSLICSAYEDAHLPGMNLSVRVTATSFGCLRYWFMMCDAFAVRTSPKNLFASDTVNNPFHLLSSFTTLCSLRPYVHTFLLFTLDCRHLSSCVSASVLSYNYHCLGQFPCRRNVRLLVHTVSFQSPIVLLKESK